MSRLPSSAPPIESTTDCARHAMSGEKILHQAKGTRADKKRSTGTNQEKKRPRTSPGSVSASGSNRQSRSVRIKPSIRKHRAQNFNVSRLNPKRKKQKTKSKAVLSSTIR